LAFDAGKHDDQVDAIGLVGQLLDRMTGGVRPKPVTNAPIEFSHYKAMKTGTDDGFKAW
jgi:hypothetical protein